MLSTYPMNLSATSLGVSVLLLITMALASSTDSYGTIYSLPAIPTLTVAILRPPFVNPPSLTAHDTQTPYSTEFSSTLITSTSTAAIENWTNTQTLDPMTATIKSQVTSFISTTYTGSEVATATFQSGETPSVTMERIVSGCAADCREANDSDGCDQTVACIDGANGKALKPTPLSDSNSDSDSGSMPLRGWSKWNLWAGWGIFLVSMLTML